MPRRAWQDWERDAVRQLYPHVPTSELAAALGRTVRTVYQVSQKLRVSKSPEYLAGPHAQRLRRDSSIGAPYRFKKGQVPKNKGLRRPGWASGRMRETQFKKGRPAQMARNYVPIGSLKLDKQGVLIRKVTDDPSRVPARRWQSVHSLVWAAHHGDIPERHIVVFKAGRRTAIEADITIDRLECISRVENMRRNTYHSRYPPEVKQLIRTRGALTKMINSRSKREEQDSGRT